MRNAGYNAELTRRSKYFAVYISRDVIRKHPELLAKVCEVLRRMLNEAVSEGKTRRINAITKVMTKLGCQSPAQGPRA